MGRVAISPLIPYEEIMLLAPHHACKGLTLDIAQIVRHGKRAYSVVEIICLFPLPFNDLIKLFLV